MPISELQAITGCSVLMYPPRAASARLVLTTFADGSDVSVVSKHEIQFVLGIFNRHLLSHESIICSWSYRPGRSLLSGIHHAYNVKGTVGSGNASWIRVFGPKPYRTVLY